MLASLQRCLYLAIIFQGCINGRRLQKRMDLNRAGSAISHGLNDFSAPSETEPSMSSLGSVFHSGEKSASPSQGNEPISEIGAIKSETEDFKDKQSNALDNWKKLSSKILDFKTRAEHTGASFQEYLREQQGITTYLGRIDVLVSEIFEDTIPHPTQDPDRAHILITKPIFELKTFLEKDFLPFLQLKHDESVSKVLHRHELWLQEHQSKLNLKLQQLQECLHLLREEGGMEEIEIKLVAAVLGVLDMSYQHALIDKEEVQNFFNDERIIKIVGEHLVYLYGEKYPNFSNPANFKPDMDYLLRDPRTSHLHACLEMLNRPTQGKIIYRSIQTAFADTRPNEGASDGNLFFMNACTGFLDDSFLEEFEWRESSESSEIKHDLGPKLEIVYTHLARIYNELPPDINQLEFLTVLHFLNFFMTYNANNIEKLIYSNFKGFKDKYDLISRGLKIHELRNVIFSKDRPAASNALIGFTSPTISHAILERSIGAVSPAEYDQQLKKMKSDAQAKTWLESEIVSSVLEQIHQSRMGLISPEEVKKNEWLQDFKKDPSNALTSSPSETNEDRVQSSNHADVPTESSSDSHVSGFGAGRIMSNVYQGGASVIKSVSEGGSGTISFVARGGVHKSVLNGAKYVLQSEVGSTALAVPRKVVNIPHDLLTSLLKTKADRPNGSDV
ncbi:hypothetical protein PGT21_025964 [Puccinia graminis f. sp. tritici]|uniref:Uncharacterized protein n=1 Tax=Puccinia graminis f. sp. tritici TaxID=56615 RepID=A0A5B0MEB2_PUCGR|nr:hypothetical protein PGT21_025964 [Puccinia graminis f. sp. tritici]